MRSRSVTQASNVSCCECNGCSPGVDGQTRMSHKTHTRATFCSCVYRRPSSRSESNSRRLSCCAWTARQTSCSSTRSSIFCNGPSCPSSVLSLPTNCSTFPKSCQMSHMITTSSAAVAVPTPSRSRAARISPTSVPLSSVTARVGAAPHQCASVITSAKFFRPSKSASSSPNPRSLLTIIG